ncbi:MAG: diadenosine tetraphosphate (Ap4A) HIT family hydrolase [Rickettsiales bacterium]|jgi:diadenosine tetraphosphate (Ap4A) HIT family hydrolase
MSKKYDSNNIFTKIIRGEIPCNKVFEDEKILAFHDISKAAPIHILVVPKGEYSSFDDFSEYSSAQEISDFFKTVRKIAIDQGLEKSGYRLITNHGSDASQSVAHFHVHILGGKQLGGLIPDDKLIR